MVATTLKNTYSRAVNFRLNSIKVITYLLVLLLALGAVVACGLRGMPNYLKSREALLQRVITEKELEELKSSFDQNPQQYSQQLFDASIARMHQICPEFALEFAQIPELNDGVSSKEAGATWNISESLNKNIRKAGGVPPDLFGKKQTGKKQRKGNAYEIIIEWRGDGAEKVEWELEIGASDRLDASYMGRVLKVETIGFEQGEDTTNLQKKVLEVRSLASSSDTDGIKAAISFPESGRIVILVNKSFVSVSYADLLGQKQVVYDKDDDLNGVLTVKSAYQTGLTPELLAIRDMVLAGEGDERCGSALRAWLEFQIEGHVEGEGDNPLKDYSLVGFVAPILDRFKGTEKEDNFEYVVSWLNDRRLALYYVKNNFTFDRGRLKEPQSPEDTFRTKSGVCRHYSTFVTHCLSKAGKTAKNLTVTWGRGSWTAGHTVSVEKENGEYWVAIDAKSYYSISSIRSYGPFNSYSQIAKSIAGRKTPTWIGVETNTQLINRIRRIRSH